MGSNETPPRATPPGPHALGAPVVNTPSLTFRVELGQYPLARVVRLGVARVVHIAEHPARNEGHARQGQDHDGARVPQQPDGLLARHGRGGRRVFGELGREAHHHLRVKEHRPLPRRRTRGDEPELDPPGGHHQRAGERSPRAAHRSRTRCCLPDPRARAARRHVGARR